MMIYSVAQKNRFFDLIPQVHKDKKGAPWPANVKNRI